MDYCVDSDDSELLNGFTVLCNIDVHGEIKIWIAPHLV